MFVIGTAGHVDHGKSTLVTALTGVDPDRLAEEKKRGLTIDLGFAWFTTPSGKEVGVVDVPGHQRFIHNMLAGAAPLDSVIFVVDANEGWKAQSEEHLAVLDLFGVRSGVIAITKSDIARAIEQTTRDVRDHLTGTVLEQAPIVPVSAITGSGMQELIAHIDERLHADDRGGIDKPRLCVDRSFSVKGSGTVVTGTLSGGSLSVGQDIVMLPQGLSARIRGIQAHKTSRDVVRSTSRVALNLAGIERSQVRRGDVVVTPGRWLPTKTFDAELITVRSLQEPMTGRGAYLLYLGSSEVHARVRLLDVGTLPAGMTAFARIDCTEPIVAQPNDRFVLRDAGRSITIAGGRVLDAHPLPARPSSIRIAQLQRRAQTQDFAEATIRERLAVRTEDLEPLSGSDSTSGAIKLHSYWLSKESFDTKRQRIVSTLESYHAAHSLEAGMKQELLQAEVGIKDARLFADLIAAIEGIGSESGLIAASSHNVVISDPQRERLLQQVEESMYAPPTVAELERAFGALVKALLHSGDLVRVSKDFAFSSQQLANAKTIIAQAAGDGITAAQIKELLGTTRKYAIPLLEYFDEIGFTKRVGDVRVVR